MWIWDGKITPEPGEHISDAAKEAIEIAKKYGAGSKLSEASSSTMRYECWFPFSFNDVPLRAFRDSTPEEIAAEYERSLEEQRASKKSSA